MDYINDIKAYINMEIEVLKKLDIKSINAGMNLIMETRENGGRIYTLGNGGSAATASHMQNDFNKGLSEYIDVKFDFCCLNDNISTLMAIANDIGYDEIFKFQLKNKLKSNDLLIAISGSGNSRNVINAVEYAKSCDVKILTFTGYDGGILKTLSDVSMHAPINSMQITEDIHMIYDHLIMAVLYKVLCNKEHCE